MNPIADTGQTLFRRRRDAARGATTTTRNQQPPPTTHRRHITLCSPHRVNFVLGKGFAPLESSSFAEAIATEFFRLPTHLILVRLVFYVVCTYNFIMDQDLTFTL